MRNVFKSFEKLNVEIRSGVIINPTTKGLKIETFTIFTEDKEHIYFITPTKEFNKDTQWNNEIEFYGDIIKVWEKLLILINNGQILPYKTITK